MDQPVVWKAHVLGTAQDGGVPHFGCYRPCCQRARRDTRYRRLVACLGLLNPATGEAFLVDATPDIREQVDRLRASHPTQPRSLRTPPLLPARSWGGPREGQRVGAPIDAILLTHAHIGHYTGLIQLSKEVLNSRDIPVYCTARMAAFLSHNGPWDQLVRDRNVRLCVLSPDETVPFGDGLTVQAIPVPHRAEYTDTLAFHICGPHRKLLYLPDINGWDRWERDLAAEIESVDYALLDGSFYSADELPWRDFSAIGHPLITDTMERLGDRPDGPEACVYFTHLNHTNPVLDEGHAARKHVEARGYHIAEEGLVLSL